LSSTLLRTPPSWSFCWPAGTVITYNALLSACEKAGQWQQALHLGVFLAISIYRYLQIFWSLASSNHGNGVPSQLESSIHRELMGIVHCHVWLPEGSWPPRVSWRLRPSTDEPNDWWFFKNRCPSQQIARWFMIYGYLYGIPMLYTHGYPQLINAKNHHQICFSKVSWEASSIWNHTRTPNIMLMLTPG
jgi:hypothetical protein